MVISKFILALCRLRRLDVNQVFDHASSHTDEMIEVNKLFDRHAHARDMKQAVKCNNIMNKRSGDLLCTLSLRRRKSKGISVDKGDLGLMKYSEKSIFRRMMMKLIADRLFDYFI